MVDSSGCEALVGWGSELRSSCFLLFVCSFVWGRVSPRRSGAILELLPHMPVLLGSPASLLSECISGQSLMTFALQATNIFWMAHGEKVLTGPFILPQYSLITESGKKSLSHTPDHTPLLLSGPRTFQCLQGPEQSAPNHLFCLTSTPAHWITFLLHPFSPSFNL